MNSYVFLLATLVCVSAKISRYSTSDHGTAGYHGPLARPVVLSDGYLADTHEVAAAQHAHYVAYANSASRPKGYDSKYYRARARVSGYASGYAGHNSYNDRSGSGYSNLGQYASYTGQGYPAYYGQAYGYGGHSIYTYGPGTGDVYTGQYGYAGLSSAPYGNGNGYRGHQSPYYSSYDRGKNYHY